MSEFTLTKTQRNKSLLVCKGFSYIIHRTGEEKVYWKCEHAGTSKYKGRIHTNIIHTVIFHENDKHNHAGNPLSCDIRLFQKKVRDRAINYNESTQTVIDKCFSNISDYAVAPLPTFKYIKRNIQNYRAQTDLPKIPQDKSFDKIPDIFTVTQRNDNFLQYDSGPGADRILTLHGYPGVHADPFLSISLTIFAEFVVPGLIIFLISYLMSVNKMLNRNHQYFGK